MTIYNSDAGVRKKQTNADHITKDDKEVEQMKKRNLKSNNKGFTLVELIVVLVILAILAAILVPALLGYIDSARNKQTLLNARSALTAAQAEMSAIYGTRNPNPANIVSANHAKNLSATADFANLSPKVKEFEVGCESMSIPDGATKSEMHKAFTINYVHYQDERAEVWYVDGEWLDTEPTEGKPDSPYDIVTSGKVVGETSN